MKTLFNKFVITLLLFTLTTTSTQAESSPDDLAKKLHYYLKTKIEWVDVNFNSQSFKMTIRYFPCFSTRAPLDHLIQEVIKANHDYAISNPGKHQLVEGYCILKDIEFDQQINHLEVTKII